MNNLDDLPCDDIIHFRESSDPTIFFDIELQNIDRLTQYDSVELHLVFSPYSRNVTSKNFIFFPYEDYSHDISTHMKSIYTKIGSIGDNLFGLGLGFALAVIFYIFKPSELFSVESVVSIIAAYAIGKELWADIDNGLVRLTKNWRIQFRKSYYLYRMERGTTLTRYAQIAQSNRYGLLALNPGLFDFIQQKSSQTLRMYFDSECIRAHKGASAHIFSIRVDPETSRLLVAKGYMIGMKTSFNRHCAGLIRSVELFQSISKTMDSSCKGCIDSAGEWREGAIFYRRTEAFGRLKYFAEEGIVDNVSALTVAPVESIASDNP